MDYYTIGVTASWTLWDFNEARSKAKSQNYSAQSLTATRNDALTTLTTRVRTTENSWRAARPAEENFKKRLELETRRSELIKNKLAAGLASESQWLDAQDDLTAAELEWISSVVALRLSEADYLYAIGR
jgi:outer membrane protein TolC